MTILIYVLVFLSGISALIYQLLWQRQLGLLFGVSSFAVATVVGVFMLGLGLGSIIFSRVSERARNPIRSYALVELGIAAFALSSYVLLKSTALQQFYFFVYNNSDFYTLSLVRLLLSSLMLLPSAIMIGATMPFLARFLIRTNATRGSTFSVLYLANTLGAFVGAVLAGFVLIRYFGVFTTFIIAMALNILVAAVSAVISRSVSQSPDPQHAHSGVARYTHPMLYLVFLTGFITFGFEVLWVRVLSIFGGATTYAFTLILCGFLLGILAGTFLMKLWIDRITRPYVHLFYYSVASAAVAFVMLFLFARMEEIIAVSVRALGGKFTGYEVGNFLGFFFSFTPAIAFSLIFPLAYKIYTEDVSSIGHKTGIFYFWNTAGALCGSLAAGFVLIPFQGIWRTSAWLVCILVVIAGYMLRAGMNTFGKSHRAYATVVWVGAALAVLFMLSLNAQFYRSMWGYRGRPIYYAEGLSGTVTAFEIPIMGKSYRTLLVDSQSVAGTDPVLALDSKLLGHLPLLLFRSANPEVATKAATVGFGTGGTSYSMLLHGGQVSALEIEQKVVDANYLFHELNFNCITDPRLRVVLDDARNYLLATDEKFDVIVTDCTNLTYKRNASLYTVDYFQIMKNRLRENGVAAAWVPFAGLAFDDLRVVIASFRSAYPHTTIWYFSQHPTHFLVLVGTTERVRLDIGSLRRRMQPAVQDLKAMDVYNEYAVASMLLLGEEDVARLTDGVPLHTDDHPILEFSNMEANIKTPTRENFQKLIAYQRESILSYFKYEDSDAEKLFSSFQTRDALFGNIMFRELGPN